MRLKNALEPRPASAWFIWVAMVLSAVLVDGSAGVRAGEAIPTPAYTAELLYDAVEAKDREKVAAILAVQPKLMDVFVKPESSPYLILYPLGLTPFMWAVLTDDLDILRLFHKHGADVSVATGTDYGSVLIFAIGHDRKNAARFLIENGADLTARDNSSFTALNHAIINLTLDEGPDSDLSLIRLLIQHGADVNDRNSPALSPLGSAVHIRNLEVMEFLVANGADPTLAHSDGGTLLGNAMVSRSLGPDHFLPNDFTIEDWILAHGVAINAKDRDGNTVLWLAAVFSWNREATEYLLAHGADPWHRNHQGETPIQMLITCMEDRDIGFWEKTEWSGTSLRDFGGTFRALYAAQENPVNVGLWLAFLLFIPGLVVWVRRRNRNSRESAEELRTLEAHRDALSATPQWKNALAEFERAEVVRRPLRAARHGLAVPILAWSFCVALYWIDPLLHGLCGWEWKSWVGIAVSTLVFLGVVGAMWIERPVLRLVLADLGILVTLTAGGFIFFDIYFVLVQLRFYAIGGLLVATAAVLMTAVVLFARIRRADLVLRTMKGLAVWPGALAGSQGEEMEGGTGWDAGGGAGAPRD